MIPLAAYLVLSAALLAIGVWGALTRRSALGILMAIELILNAANINLIAFARHVRGVDATGGPMFALFVMAIAAGAAAVGLSIVICIYRNHRTVDVDRINLMKW
ncbi:MAG: NADH-quinone oxidoreductase subunit NuoK [Candidatus Sumerlaeia bacterium]|nr:NADH-quinone oxidoreductase subunit NuoK [Candidatus Sumerlaeia bacterium]